MEWMLDTQLGRRNLPPAQRLAVMDKFKKKIQEQAKEKMSEDGGDKKSNDYKNRASPNGEKRSNTKIHTDKELAKLAGVGKETYRMGAKVLNSDNEDVKQRVLKGETSISAGYKKLTKDKKKNENEKQIEYRRGKMER